jgi:hypothetical protein
MMTPIDAASKVRDVVRIVSSFFTEKTYLLGALHATYAEDC